MKARGLPPEEQIKIDVLDHGFVRLVDHMGGDVSVARAARISHDAAWRAGEDQGSDARLIRYLWAHQHSTPFEAVVFTFEVRAPIFVLRQWYRHRTWSYNELSARYRGLPEEFYLPTIEQIGEQSKTNKQGRHPSKDDRESSLQSYCFRCLGAFEEYRYLLAEGWPRELARCVLPVSTYSHMFGTVNLLNLFRFLTLRTDERAQYEIRVYANAIIDLIRPIVPVCVEAWKEEGRYGHAAQDDRGED